MSGSSNIGMHIEHCIQEDPVKLAEFEAKVARGEHIEADDWMPKAYREGMLKMAEHHANSEIIGARTQASLGEEHAPTSEVVEETVFVIIGVSFPAVFFIGSALGLWELDTAWV